MSEAQNACCCMGEQWVCPQCRVADSLCGNDSHERRVCRCVGANTMPLPPIAHVVVGDRATEAKAHGRGMLERAWMGEAQNGPKVFELYEELGWITDKLRKIQARLTQRCCACRMALQMLDDCSECRKYESDYPREATDNG